MDKIENLIKSLTELKEELEKASKDPQAPHVIAKLTSGGTVEHHPAGKSSTGHNHSDNYTIKHPKGNVHVWHDRGVEGGWQSYNQHKEDNDDGSGFDTKHANHPKIQAHIDEGIKAIKAHQVKMHGSLDDIKKPLKKSQELNKASKDPKLAPKETKIKNLQAQIDAGAYKPNAPKIADKMLNPSHNVDSELHPSVIKPENLKRLIKEELTCSANGQWSLQKAKAKLHHTNTHPLSVSVDHSHDGNDGLKFNIHDAKNKKVGHVHYTEGQVNSSEIDSKNEKHLDAVENHVHNLVSNGKV